MIDLKDRCADYLLNELHRRESTVGAYRWRWERLERYFGKPIESVNADDLRALKRSPPFAPETIKSLVVALHVFHDWGALEGLWTRNGLSLVKVPTCLQNPPKPLSKWQAREVLLACKRPLEFRTAWLPLHTGMRIGEAAIVEGPMWGEDGVIRFQGEKGGRVRQVPVHPNLERVKWKVLASEPADPDYLQRVVRRLRKRVGFHFTSHQFRDTFVTFLDEGDVQRSVTKNIIGHAGDVTDGYGETSLRRKREAVLFADYGLG